MLRFFGLQLAAEPGIGIDFALAQKDVSLRNLLMHRIFSHVDRPFVSDEYLINDRPDFLASFLELEKSLTSNNRDTEQRMYSVAGRAAMRPDRIELAHMFLTRVRDSYWRADILSKLGSTLWRSDDIEAAGRSFLDGVLAADESADPRQSLNELNLLAHGLLNVAGLDTAREMLSSARNLPDNLVRAAQARNSVDDAQAWASYLAVEVHLWELLGQTDEVARTADEAHKYINSLADADRKDRLLVAWERQKTAREDRRNPGTTHE